MADTSWKLKLIVNNTTNRTFSVDACKLDWGHWCLNGEDEKEPIDIEPGMHEVLRIRASKGTLTGYEGSCSWKDKSGKGCYGCFSIYVDVPIAKDNSSKLEQHGWLEIEGWEGLPKSGHEFEILLTIGLADDRIKVIAEELK